MIVNNQNLRGIFIGFKTIFAKAFGETTTNYDKVATVVPSETSEESYKWLGNFPKLKKWIGERQVQNLSAHGYTIKNESFEATVSVPREDIEDDKIGVYSPMIQELGQSAASHPDEIVFDLLPSGFTNKCFDGKPFFAENHPVGKATVSNKGTAKLGPESYMTARSSIMSLKDENGKPLKLVPNLLVVPPALEAEGRKILLADQINGTTNTLKGTAELLVVPDLAVNDDAWFLLCTNRSLRPLIYQVRKQPQFVSKTSETDDNVFFSKEYVYGVDKRCNAGYGFWQMAYGSTGEATA